MVEILSEVTLYRNGPFKRVQRWWKGIHPGRGKITKGFTGWETIEEVDLIVPSLIVRVDCASSEASKGCVHDI